MAITLDKTITRDSGNIINTDTNYSELNVKANGLVEDIVDHVETELTSAETQLNATVTTKVNEFDARINQIASIDDSTYNTDAIDTKATAMSKASFEAIARDNRDKFAGSGFVEWGKGYVESWGVNEGMFAHPSLSDRFFLGRANSSQSGDSKTDYPSVNVNGTNHKVLSSTGDWVNTIDLPEAPTVTHADSSNSGMVLNGRNMVDTSGWTTTNSSNILSIVNGELQYDVVVGWARGWQAIPNLIIGQKYTVEFTAYTDAATASYNNVIDLTISNLGTPVNDGTDKRTQLTTVPTRYTFEFTADQATMYLNMSSGTAGNKIFLKEAFMCPSHELSRSDLVFLESWHEDTSEKGVLYDLGNVQYKGTRTVGDAGSFVGSDTYSLFGNWQQDGALVGNSISIASLTFAELQEFVGNPENNCYYDGDKLIQVRYRVRVVQGLGDEWETVTDNGLDDTIQYTKATSRVVAKGKDTSVVSDLSAYLGGGKHFFSNLNTYTDTVIGAFESADVSGLHYLPIALVHRRNQGAYHPKFNPNGTRQFARISTGFGGFTWYYSSTDIYLPTSISDCFTAIPYATAATESGYFEHSGNIQYTAEGRNGRPDLLSYDQVSERDIIDLRNSSHKVQDYKRLLEREFNKAVSGEVRGEEGEWEITPEYQLTASNGTSTIFVSDVSAYNVGDFIVVSNMVGGNYRGFITSKGSASIVLSFTLNRVLGNILVAKKSTRKKSNTMLHCDIIGDPANYYRGQTYNDSTTQDIAIGDVIWAKAASGGGTAGNFYKALTAQSAIDLATQDYSNATNWTDLGSDWDGPGSWRTGVSGTPLVVGENGEDYIPDGTALIPKLSKKAITKALCLYSDDNGVTWTSWSLTHDTTANTLGMGVMPSNRMTLYFYETHTNMAENAVNSEVIELGDVFGTQSSSLLYGNVLISSLTNKVGVSSANGSLKYGYKVEKFSLLTDGKLSTNSDYSPVHNVLLLTLSGVPAIKILPYITRRNNKAYLVCLFKEIVGNGAGDDSKFNIVDNVSTTTDDNGNTVLIGQKRIELPYFIEDKE